MGFTTYDSIISALSGGFGRHPSYQKISITTVANAYFSLWNIAGIPAAGAFGTALTARVIDNTFAAAMPFTDPTGGRTAHLLGAGIRSTVAAGVLVLVDRLLEAPFDGTATSGTFNSGSPLAIPSRDANGAALGADCMMFVENIQATTVNAARTITVTYTNSAGNTGHSTGAVDITAASAIHRIVHTTSGLWMPLQSGDKGVRAIASYSSSGSLTSTQLNIVVCRPLLYVPFMTANSYTERDAVLQLPNLPQLYPGTAMQWLLMTNSTTSGVVNGAVTYAEN